mmetsp:Transcript_13656/g.21761  ORF Transcript_13656/g.21761 Transcript_13656/m.21761 type:complete len:245 (+) Transcript_13656:421-1155(+)
MDNVCANMVEERGIVRDNHRSEPPSLTLANEKLPQPLHCDDVQVIRGLIQQKHVCTLRDGTGECQAHLPASTQLTDSLVEHGVVEASFIQRLRRNVGLYVRALYLDKVATGHGLVNLVQNTFVLQVVALKLFHPGQIPNSDSGHQSRLPGSILTHDAIAPSTQKLKKRVAQQWLQAASIHQDQLLNSANYVFVLINVSLALFNARLALRLCLAAHGLDLRKDAVQERLEEGFWVLHPGALQVRL